MPVPMRRLIAPLLAVTLLAAAGAVAGLASSASTAATVKITKTGYSPTAVSIIVGESVAFTNSDTVAHTVNFKTTTGIHCSSAIPLVLPAGQSATCMFSTAGKFNFSDPANKGAKFRGTVTVTPPLVSSFKAPAKVRYGGKATLSGTLVSKQAGISLKVFAQQCGAAKATQAATITSGTGGAFTYAAAPLMLTTYTVTSKNLSSPAATVKVVPVVRLSRPGHRRYAVRISAAESFAGKFVSFQRLRLGHWRGVKRVLLHTNSTGVAPTVVTSAKFRSSLKRGIRVRVVLTQKQAGACYLPGISNTIRTG
jgi:plastocyanin